MLKWLWNCIRKLVDFLTKELIKLIKNIMDDNKSKRTAWANFYMFIGWPIVGALGLIFSIMHLVNPGNFSFLRIVIIGLVSLFIFLWGVKTLIRSRGNINS